MCRPPRRRRARFRSENLKEGFAYVWSTPAVLALMILAYVPRVFAVPYQTLMPVFQKDVLKVGPEGLGLLMAAPGVGAVIAVLLLASLGNRMGRQGPCLVAGIVILVFFCNTIFTDHLFSAGPGFTGSCGYLSDAFSRQHQHDLANDRAG